MSPEFVDDDAILALVSVPPHSSRILPKNLCSSFTKRSKRLSTMRRSDITVCLLGVSGKWLSVILADSVQSGITSDPNVCWDSFKLSFLRKLPDLFPALPGLSFKTSCPKFKPSAFDACFVLPDVLFCRFTPSELGMVFSKDPNNSSQSDFLFEVYNKLPVKVSVLLSNFELSFNKADPRRQVGDELALGDCEDPIFSLI